MSEPDPLGPDPAAPAPRLCAWCSAPAAPGATHCAVCGAALAQHEDLGGVVIPGVTGLDQEHILARDRPLKMPKGSPTQSAAPGVLAAGLFGGPPAIAAAGLLAALATEEAPKNDDGSAPTPLADVGVPSELAWRALEHVETQAGAPLTHPLPPEPDPTGEPPIVDAPGPDAPLNPDPWARDGI